MESAEHGLTDQAVDALAAAAAGLDVRANAMVMDFPDGGDWAGAMTAAADRIAARSSRSGRTSTRPPHVAFSA